MIYESTNKKIFYLIEDLFSCYHGLQEGEWYDVQFTCRKNKKEVDFCALIVRGAIEKKIDEKGVTKHKIGIIKL